jgi:hypothetical protein
VHPTGGSLRVFKHFAWLEVGSVKAVLSRPAHQRVTQAVRRQLINEVKKQFRIEKSADMSEFNFLKQYIERMPEEERNNPFLGYKLGKGKQGLEVSQVESQVGISVPDELKEFYEFSYGAELGEYKILTVSEIASLISELRSRYAHNWKDKVLPFAYVKGVGDMVAFDLASSNELGQFLTVDGFHEIDPMQWKGICFGLRNWLIKMTESKFEPFWLKGS